MPSTRDPVEAREPHAEVAAAVAREWRVLRSPPVLPNDRQVPAIAGPAHAEVMIPTPQDEPGPSEGWGMREGLPGVQQAVFAVRLGSKIDPVFSMAQATPRSLSATERSARARTVMRARR